MATTQEKSEKARLVNERKRLKQDKAKHKKNSDNFFLNARSNPLPSISPKSKAPLRVYFVRKLHPNGWLL